MIDRCVRVRSQEHVAWNVSAVAVAFARCAGSSPRVAALALTAAPWRVSPHRPRSCAARLRSTDRDPALCSHARGRRAPLAVIGHRGRVLWSMTSAVWAGRSRRSPPPWRTHSPRTAGQLGPIRGRRGSRRRADGIESRCERRTRGPSFTEVDVITCASKSGYWPALVSGLGSFGTVATVPARPRWAWRSCRRRPRSSAPTMLATPADRRIWTLARRGHRRHAAHPLREGPSSAEHGRPPRVDDDDPATSVTGFEETTREPSSGRRTTRCLSSRR